MVSLSLAKNSAYAACPDSTYVSINVKIGTSDCLNLEECGHIYVVFYWENSGTPILRIPWNQNQTIYECCVPGPITLSQGDICAVLIIQPGYCTDMTLPPAPTCTQFTFPYYGSQSPYPLTLDDYCLKYQ